MDDIELTAGLSEAFRLCRPERNEVVSKDLS